MFNPLQGLLDKMKSQEGNRPDKGDLVSVEGMTDNLWIVTDVVDHDTICRVTSVRKGDNSDRIIPFWQIKANWSASCK